MNVQRCVPEFLRAPRRSGIMNDPVANSMSSSKSPVRAVRFSTCRTRPSGRGEREPQGPSGVRSGWVVHLERVARLRVREQPLEDRDRLSDPAAHQGTEEVSGRRHEAVYRRRTDVRRQGWIRRALATSEDRGDRVIRPRPLRAEPDRLAAPRQRADGGREPRLRRRARRRVGARASTTRMPRERSRRARRRSSTISAGSVSVGRGARAPERAGRRLRRGRGAGARARRGARRRRLDPARRHRRSSAPDGTATYQLARVVDDLDARDHPRHPRDRITGPNEAVQQRIARALGGELPPVIHHGLVLGDGREEALEAARARVGRRAAGRGVPAEAVRAYLDELGLPAHDVQLDEARLAPARDRRDRRDVRRGARRLRRGAG